MFYATIGFVVLTAVVAIIAKRTVASRRATITETERDIERAEGEGMVTHPRTA
jgi:hypothetical protein